MLRVVRSTSARARLDAAAQFLETRPPFSEVVVVGASRGAADDLARAVAQRLGATFGILRFSLTELAARAAGQVLETRRIPGTQAVNEAMAARATFDATLAGELAYFAPVAKMPGFPKALARTIHELRLAGCAEKDDSTGSGIRLLNDRSHPAVGDLECLLTHVETERARSGIDDRAALFDGASRAWRSGRVTWAGLPLVLLDVTIDSRAEQEFVQALIEHASAALATIPDGDLRARAAFERMGASIDVAPDAAQTATDLAHLRKYVFTNERPPLRERSGDVTLFSAPGEGREALEIVRRILDEAQSGVRFDEIAVFLRTPQPYLGLLEHAAARGGVPVYFDRGTRRPDPAGRAFVALLSCGVDGLSAKRFDEYLSLGQVPRLDPSTSLGTSPATARGAGSAQSKPNQMSTLITPRDEVFERSNADTGEVDDPESAVPAPPMSDSDEDAIVAGTLRSPWKWEELIVESSVVGGRTREDGKLRWRRRLDGLAEEYRVRIAELAREEPESARIRRFERDLANLTHLRRFALPIVDALAEWPEQATWGDWISRFSALAHQALVRPDRVLRTLADLRPMSDVGPVSLEEARDVLHDRLVTLDWDPPVRRYGRVFVGTPHQARGRSFRVVFVPGLAERVVPQRPREDPLLLDDRRRDIDADLLLQDDRSGAERLLLKIAIGAASERLYLSYPRMDVAETRARVPSFYALDVMRAITGRVPDHRVLAADAAEEAGANLAWPAPRDPDRAIDDLEHDLSVLKPLLDSRDPAAVKGRAHYLLGLNEPLRRSVIARWSRGRTVWSPSDGLIKVTPAIAPTIAKNRLGQRPYSLSALQRFSACPYQFLLATIHRLEPWDEPEPLVRMDPLTRGSLFHKVQAEFLRAMDHAVRLPVALERITDAARLLDRTLDRVAKGYEEKLAPAIERVWRDEIGELRRDLGIWLRKLAGEHAWVPKYFEFSFGLNDEGRDPRSLPGSVLVDGRFILRGSVDVIEHRSDLDVYRVTDHKTGKNRSNKDLIVGGGAVLQPVLYSAAIEQGLGVHVVEGRLFYCTTAGGFGEHPIVINDYTKTQGLEVLEIVDRAVERGFLVAAPAERACAWCDFRPVCGPREEERIKRKSKEQLADLEALRSMR
jgi:CRISPR/Cas system-associated exonuclease Cas4 (RecB family)